MTIEYFFIGIVCIGLAVNVFMFMRFERMHGKRKL